MARFFIDRPVFAWVVSIIIMLCGLLALRTLPVSQYPDIAPPQITVSAVYPGASALAVEQSVTQVIEQQMTGLDGMRYISSSSDSSGLSQVKVTFNAGVNPDMAQVQVQNKLARATPLLPQEVQRQGVRVSKGSAGFLMVIALTSPGGTYDQTDLGDYIGTNLLEPISRAKGVGSTTLFGASYAMRIWLDPEKLDQFNLVPADVIGTITQQNIQVSAGKLGAEPSRPGQSFTAAVSVQSLKSTPEQFAQMPILTTPEGATITLGEVADVELGASGYAFGAFYNGQPAAGLSVSLAAGANALETAEEVKHLVADLTRSLPADMVVEYPYETTPFVKESILQVEHTLVEAVVLVLLVIFVFLQSLRATFPPMMAIPVVLLGTFVVMAVAGFSINMLTLFAMILAIGLLVDDAIVVVENVERVMEEDGLGPYEATVKSMDQITGALVGIVIVLSAVFLPMAFFPGSTGVIYRQFSLTIISAMVLSLIVALVLTPAICARLLKKHEHKAATEAEARPWWRTPGRAFNAGFDRLTNAYVDLVDRMLRFRVVSIVIFMALLALTAFGFARLPTAFLPDEDQGAVMAMAQLPSDASLPRTNAYMNDLSRTVLQAESDIVEGVFTVSGFSFTGRGENQGIAFITTKDWAERPSPDQSVGAIAGRLSRQLAANEDGVGFAFFPPAMPQLGAVSGFDLFLQDTSGVGRDALNASMMQVVGSASGNPSLANVRPNEQSPKPQFKVTIDYPKAQAMGVTPGQITSLMAVALGGSYVNDFIDRGRIKQVQVQGVTGARMQPQDIGRWRVRNPLGQMISLEQFIATEWRTEAPLLNRYNGLPAVNIQGMAAPGKSSGEAMLQMESIIETLPEGFGFEWTGISAEEREAGGQAGALYLISIVFIFLCLAALYESWTVPIAVLLAAPLGVMGAVALVAARGLTNDVFFQVGILTTVGLAAKNAILIVEFAKELEEKGVELVEATLRAARMRLRPILMTSFAFGLGVLPLALGTGAGAGARVAIGTAVFGGMLASSALGILFTPLLYVVLRSSVRRVSHMLRGSPKQEVEEEAAQS